MEGKWRFQNEAKVPPQNKKICYRNRAGWGRVVYFNPLDLAPLAAVPAEPPSDQSRNDLTLNTFSIILILPEIFDRNHQRVAGDAPESRLRGELGADFPKKLKPHPGTRPGAVPVLSPGGEGPKQGDATSANERSEQWNHE